MCHTILNFSQGKIKCKDSNTFIIWNFFIKYTLSRDFNRFIEFISFMAIFQRAHPPSPPPHTHRFLKVKKSLKNLEIGVTSHNINFKINWNGSQNNFSDNFGIIKFMKWLRYFARSNNNWQNVWIKNISIFST